MKRILNRTVLVIWGLTVPGWLQAQISGAFSSPLSVNNVNNHTGFIIASDAGSGGRQAIRARADVEYTTVATARVMEDFRLDYQLLDGQGQPVSIQDETGQTNTVYSVYDTVTLDADLFQDFAAKTYAAPLVPLAALDPYQTYTVQARLFASPRGANNYAATGASASFGPNPYYVFPNSTPDPNVLVTLGAISPGPRSWAINQSPDQGGFPVSLNATVWRYDTPTAPPSAVNVVVGFSFQLVDGSGNAVPLKTSSATASVSILSHDTATPPRPATQPVATTISVEPADGVELDPSADYRLVVALSHAEGGLVVNDFTNATPLPQLLQLSGRLLCGPLPVVAQFADLTVAPTAPVPAVNGEYWLTISPGSGWLTNDLGHTFVGGQPLDVLLLANGDVVLQPGVSISLNAQATPDAEIAGNMSFHRSGLRLSSAGASGDVTLSLPAGLSVSATKENHLTKGQLDFGTVPLDGSLHPLNGTLSSGPWYAIEETLPVWFYAGQVSWDFAAGLLTLDVQSIEFVRQDEDALLQTSQTSLVEPDTAHRVSNDGYFRNAAAAGPITVAADANGVARLSGPIALNPPELRPHFPYSGRDDGTQMATTGGTLVLQNGQVSSDSLLTLASGMLPVPYGRNCPDQKCGGGSTLQTILAFTPNDRPALGFTGDGGLLAYGTTQAADLVWGYGQDANGNGTFAQRVFQAQADAYVMAGTFLLGDQTAQPNEQRAAVLLFTGFGNETNAAYMERLGDTEYTNGFANYAGLNFRSPPSQWSAISHIADQNTPSPYRLMPNSKYYARYGGVSGIHQAVPAGQPGGFPTTLRLYGYGFTFTSYGVSYLDSANHESRTDGAVDLPWPSRFTQNFENMTFLCRGALDSAQVPASSDYQPLAYWNTSIHPLSIDFSPVNPVPGNAPPSCADSTRFLVLGVEMGLPPYITNVIHAALGFKPDGNLVTPADRVAATDSRFPLPATLGLTGPGTSAFAVSIGSEGYFNNWAMDPNPLMPNGFYNVAGSVRVPFFQDVKVHVHVTANGGRPGDSSTPVLPPYVMGGWPTPDGQAHNVPPRGWTDNGENFFNWSKFDPASVGYPTANNAKLSDYRNRKQDDLYHPRAQRDWISVAFFDYPLNWSGVLNSFTGFQPAPAVLPMITVNSRLKQISPGKVDFDFSQDFSVDFPRIRALDLLNDAVNETNNPLRKLTSEISGSIGKQLDVSGLNALHQALRQDPTAFLQPLVEAAFGITTPTQPGSLVYDQLLSLQDPQATPDEFLKKVYNVIQGSGGSGLSATITSALGGLSGSPDSLINKQLSGLLDRAADALGVVSDTAESQQAVGSIARAFSSLSPDSAALQEVAPALTALQQQLTDLRAQLQQFASDLKGGAGDLSAALANQADTSQFLPLAGKAITNYLASIMTPAGDFLTGDPATMKRALRTQLLRAFLGSPQVAGVQTALRQVLAEPDALADQLIEEIFDQVNEVVQQSLVDPVAIPQNLTGPGQLSQSLLAAKVRGSPTFNGDSLQKIHLDADVQMNVPKKMEFKAFMDIVELNSQSTAVGCILPGDAAAEVTLGAKNVDLSAVGLTGTDGSPIILSLDARWTLQNSKVIGLGGSLDLKGSIGADPFVLKELAATLEFGETENYVAARGAGVIYLLGIPFDVTAGFFAGHACSVDTLKFIDPDVGLVLNDTSGFSGLYLVGSASLSLSDLIFGTSTCLLDLGASCTTAAFLGVDTSGIGLSAGIKQRVSADASVLCLLSGHVDFTLAGSVHGSLPDANITSPLSVISSLWAGGASASVRLTASADLCGSIGVCPICKDGCFGLRLSGTVTETLSGNPPRPSIPRISYTLDY